MRRCGTTRVAPGCSGTICPPGCSRVSKRQRSSLLATSNARGECDCSFKGGGPGLIRILDATHFAFPDKPGNGAFMSLGNLLENPRLGCLFIDFSTGERLRVNGRARLVEGEEAHALFPDHPRAVVVTVEQVVPNCNAHVPRLIPAGEK